jgi:hypothetical protein
MRLYTRTTYTIEYDEDGQRQTYKGEIPKNNEMQALAYFKKRNKSASNVQVVDVERTTRGDYIG